MADYENVHPADIRFDGAPNENVPEEVVEEVVEVAEQHGEELENGKDEVATGTGQESGYEALAPGSSIMSPPNPR